MGKNKNWIVFRLYFRQLRMNTCVVFSQNCVETICTNRKLIWESLTQIFAGEFR
jgi:hypothetical protein